MFKARNSGKKLLAVRIVKDTFDIIHLLTDENPLQVFVKAIMNSGPREDSTRIGSAGVVRRQAVDVSPFRRVNQAIYLISHGVRVYSRGALLCHVMHPPAPFGLFIPLQPIVAFTSLAFCVSIGVPPRLQVLAAADAMLGHLCASPPLCGVVS